MEKKSFLIRLILFLIFSLAIPIVYVSIRFHLFTNKQIISIWGIILLIIILCVVVVMIKFYLDGMKTKFSYLKQILMGTIKVLIPIAIVWLLCFWIKSKIGVFVSNVDLMVETLSVIFVSELFAIIINPLPKWAFENNVDGLVQITDKILRREQ